MNLRERIVNVLREHDEVRNIWSLANCLEEVIKPLTLQAVDPGGCAPPVYVERGPIALSAPQPVVSVKPLEWDDEDYCPSAKCAFGHYVIHPRYCHVELLFGYGGSVMMSLCRIELDAGGTIDELKAAAQADYETRIRSALSAQVQDVSETYAKAFKDAITIGNGYIRVNSDGSADLLDPEAVLIVDPAAKQDAPETAEHPVRYSHFDGSKIPAMQSGWHPMTFDWQTITFNPGRAMIIDNVDFGKLYEALRGPESAEEVKQIIWVSKVDAIAGTGQFVSKEMDVVFSTANSWNNADTPYYAHPPSDAALLEEAKARAAELERLRFEGDLDKWMKIIGAGITGYQPEAYATMDAACGELVRSRTLLEEAVRALEPFAKHAVEVGNIKQRAFMQLLICPSDDEDPANHTPYFQRASATLEKIKARLG
ncbi:hypothetical protein HGO34_15605 [Agrobacterium vitis]|uniref:hypothetical protein n=1 Tax=Agrobacterium vitis TaxID=373 RepID=UPI0020338A28|nr:hypothetical protein [Agrobacterium vitis]MCM2441147.1 hypothetical protein [Agrobacterium vitis]